MGREKGGGGNERGRGDRGLLKFLNIGALGVTLV